MNRLTMFGTAALVAALAFPAAATVKHTHHAHTVRPTADAAGAAAGTGVAVATAPFGMVTAYNDGHYGYYGAGWNGGRWDQAYSSRNGMACTPGTWVKGDDGRRHPCQ
jgi:hypothetical protein